MPELWRLPVDGSNETANHRPGRLLHFCETEVCDLRNAFGGDEDIGRLAVPMNDRGLPGVQVLQAACDIEHDT